MWKVTGATRMSSGHPLILTGPLKFLCLLRFWGVESYTTSLVVLPSPLEGNTAKRCGELASQSTRWLALRCHGFGFLINSVSFCFFLRNVSSSIQRGMDATSHDQNQLSPRHSVNYLANPHCFLDTTSTASGYSDDMWHRIVITGQIEQGSRGNDGVLSGNCSKTSHF